MKNGNFITISQMAINPITTNPEDELNCCEPQLPEPAEIGYRNLKETIYGFFNLQDNWDSYNANAISKNAIDAAIETLNHLYVSRLLSDYVKVSIFPMRDGGIQFEFDGDNICAELEIDENGMLTFILFEENGSIVNSRRLLEISQLSLLLEEAQNA